MTYSATSHNHRFSEHGLVSVRDFPTKKDLRKRRAYAKLVVEKYQEELKNEKKNRLKACKAKKLIRKQNIIRGKL